jgi:hypothetical protein
MDKETDWVLPAGIPFADLKGRDLEECVYWLLDAMGARDLEWRTGGSGGGAADGGRDLEATFYVPGPDGEMEPQRWWIECKGRKGTVDPDEVKSAANNCMARPEVAYLVVVTNTNFSNPTRDWVKQWQNGRPRPGVKLWDQGTLERLLSQHPNVVLRLFSEALSAPGLLKAVQQRFWERLEHMPVKALRTFWSERDTIEISPLERFALIANEFAHGSIGARPWAAHASPQQLMETVHIAFTNLPYLMLRSSRVGVDQEPILAALAHLIIAALQITTADALVQLLLEHCLERNGEAFPETVIDALLVPVIDRVAGEMQDICASDCDRIMASDPTTLVGSEDPVKSYWRRLDSSGAPPDPDSLRHLLIERHDGPCKVGFALDREHSCPLFDLKLTASNIAEFLAIVERVSGFRLAEARARAAQKTREEEAQAAARKAAQL